MRKFYARVVFGPDDTTVGSPLPTMEDEISDLLDVTEVVEPVGDAPSGEEGSVPEAPSGDNPSGESVTPTPEVTPSEADPGVGEIPSPAGEVVPTPSATLTGDGELVALKAQIATLQSLVEKLSSGVAPTPTVTTPPTVPIPASAAVAVATPDAILEDFLSKIDYDKTMETKESFIDFMKQFAGAIRNSTSEHVLTAVPNVVGSYVNRQSAMRDIAKQFYGEHPNLKPVKVFVGNVANEVAAEHPEWNVVQVLSEAATRAYTTLGIAKEVKKQEQADAAKPTKPSLPGGSQSVKSKPAPSGGLIDEINDLISD